MSGSPDAVVVGSGPNGLAAALTLAAAGLVVLVIEGASSPGGGCRTEELTLPGYRHDVCATAHPLALASSFFTRFDLRARGVRLAHPGAVFAHPLERGRAAVVRRSVDETAADLGADGTMYRDLLGPLVAHWSEVADWVLSDWRSLPRSPFAVAGYGIRAIGPASALARRFRTEDVRALMAGVSAHSMRPLETSPTAGVGLFLTILAHAVGWPFVEGGSARLITAMVDALQAAGGRIETGWWLSSLDELPPARAVLLDVTPRRFLEIAGPRLNGRYRRSLEGFRYGVGVCKVDFALAGPVPWSNSASREAGTLHLGGTFEEVARSEAAVVGGRHPDRPYVLAVQAGSADPTRAPAGGHTLWTYCHVPAGSNVDMSDRIEAQVERYAPGFRDLILAKTRRSAAEQEHHNPNYVGGDIGSGRQDLGQTLARPAMRWDPYRTPLRGIYLCSSATPPGPGVHGRCGELAALSALRHSFGISDPPDVGRWRPTSMAPPAGA